MAANRFGDLFQECAATWQPMEGMIAGRDYLRWQSKLEWA
eukprot:CAMPEP_0174355254 /NCGR_PEP_ID=MMETSP0811_2-20130205/23547_1 /TAXON_ID=73025 ORGANISM="Eutreptiella gymnastica-like, Strain CCMP1594" /NCGR_SAMPLE_ID=MMETSP0811_2 /ASSEMBLY_ACC=CAM_ASM_000667 /LENGTH=39 /DNA_ID= /DNA_START= /DNA_END= /DNA_ORIENTATION=